MSCIVERKEEVLVSVIRVIWWIKSLSNGVDPPNHTKSHEFNHWNPHSPIAGVF
jgi:hypothetical protein